MADSAVTTEDLPLLDKRPASPDLKKVRVGDEGTEYSLGGVIMIFLFPAMGGFLFGYDIGATSMTLVQMQSASYSGTQWYSDVANSSVLQGVITSIGVGGAMVGSLICFQIADIIGRRHTLLAASLQFFLGSMIEFMSGVSTWPAWLGISVLLLGRLTYGLGCGFAMHGAPAYIGEMAPPSIRGVLVALKEAVIVLGMLAGYLLGWLFEQSVGGWRYVYGSVALLSLIMAVGVSALPPSARWLVLQDRPDEAVRSIRYVMPRLPKDCIADIVGSQGLAKKAEGGGWEGMNNPIWRPALVAGVGLVFLQQITGQPSVLYYADTIFEDVGMSSFSAVLIGLFKLVATLFAVYNVDRHGRRKLLFIGCALMLGALLVLGVAFCFSYVSESDCNAYSSSSGCAAVSQCEWSSSCGDDSCSSSSDATCTCCTTDGIDFQKGTILTALFIYIGGYQVGFGPVVWLIIAEIFPLELRGKAISLAVVTNFFWNMVVTFFFPVEIEWIGAAATFFIFAGLTLFSIYFIHRNVPETKGLTLEQIEDLFRSRVMREQASA